MELFLTKSGPRVDINKTGGLFRKTPGRTGTRGFRPLDLDLRVLVGLIQDLIQAVAYGSGGQDRLGARAAALVAGALLLRRRGTGSSPDFGISVLPSSNRSGLGSGS